MEIFTVPGTITVKDDVKSIRVTSLPDKKEYKSDEPFDPAGIRIEKTLLDDSVVELAADDPELAYTYDFSREGEAVVTVTYRDYHVAEFTVTVMSFIRGDVNGDGLINNRDIVRLKSYLANLDDETGVSTVEVSPGADVDGNGVINNRDLVRLKTYIANYDEDTGVSTVTLGPA